MTKKYNRTANSNKGFTLIEVLISVAVLAFGIVVIYEALFVTVDTHSYYRHYLSTQGWINEQIWDVQEELINSKELEVSSTTGQIVRNFKTFEWAKNVSLLNESQKLYKVHITLSWHEGRKKVTISRTAYLLPPDLKEYNEKSST